MSPLPSRIGRYTILERLAVGGMAVVYLGFEQGDTGLQRLVVIKQILPNLGEEETFRRMFMQEARLAAQINHPNVVEIYELATWEEEPFIAMEYVVGVPLNILMRHANKRETQVPVGVACGIIMQACAGAHAAHEMKDSAGNAANLVHRDLTPHNLMISESGHVKVLDFGVAKAATNQEQTATGMLKGKLPYMSPEQLWQSEIDRRSDVFTLGVVFWELMLGTRLFAREAEVATINAVLNATLPDLKGVRMDVPSAIIDVAMKALAKDPTERYSSADDFRRSLQEVVRQEGLNATDDAVHDFVAIQLGTSLQLRRQELQEQVERSMADFRPSTAVEESVDPMEVQTDRGVSKPVASPTKMANGTGAKRGILIGAVSSFVVVGGLLFTLVQSGVLGKSDSTPGPSESLGGGTPITVMLAPTVRAENLRKDLEPLRRYLGRTLERPVEWRFAKSYAGAGEAVRLGKVEFASLPPTLYVETKAAEPKVELLAVKIHSGGNGSDGFLLVHEDAQVTNPEDLKGKRICYTDPHSTTGYVYPRATLRGWGLDPETDFAKPDVYSQNHHQLIIDLIDGKCDLGGTFAAAYTSAKKTGINAAKPVSSR